MFAYSPRKNSAKDIDEYSTLYPATSSASASGKSNGSLFVSASTDIKNTTDIARSYNKRVAKQLSNDLDNVVLKALAKDPEARYASVESFKQDLLRYLDGQPVQARADSMGYRAQKYIQRHAFAVASGVGVSTVLAIALAITSWQANQALKEANRAEAMQGFVVALFENTGDKANPEDINVRELLDAGVRRADTELVNQPQARAELLGLIARLRSGLGDDREALRLLDKQAMAFMQLDINTPAQLRLESLTVRGHSLRQLGQNAACVRDLAPYLQMAEDLADYCTRAGRPVPKLSLSNAQRRWGSCSAKGAVRINWRLVMAPDFVRRSVVAHEVAHLVHFDHSPQFHALLGQIYESDIAEANRWLKREGRGLYAHFG